MLVPGLFLIWGVSDGDLWLFSRRSAIFAAIPFALGGAWTSYLVGLLAYAAASLVLLAFGLATMGLGLVLALPLWVASTYAAWKDIFGIRDAPVA